MSGNQDGCLSDSGNSEKRADLLVALTPNVRAVPGGKLAREVAERRRINQLGGTRNVPGSQTSNIRNPIGRARSAKAQRLHGPM